MSVVANLLVILVIFFRKRKFKSTHIFIVALAISDTLFSVAIHPMLIATSFGVSPHELFGVSGKTSVQFSLFRKRTVTTDRHFLLQCIHTNKFISYSGSQSYMAASFSTKESQQTRRRVVGGPFNGRPLPE